MTLIELGPRELGIAALGVLLLGLTQAAMGLGLTRSLWWSSLRMTAQLLLVGVLLKSLFEAATLGWVLLMALVMVSLAGLEIIHRQKRRLSGAWSYLLGVIAMGASALTLAGLTLGLILQTEPWYTPQYAIPLLGMILGNTMTGIGVALNQLTQNAWQQQAALEGRLMLGQSYREATLELRREAIRSGMIPVINMLAVAGVVSLPGMMTGQILSGTPPLEAVKYQILIMFLVATGTGFGTLLAVSLASRRLFDTRERLRLDRLA